MHREMKKYLKDKKKPKEKSKLRSKTEQVGKNLASASTGLLLNMIRKLEKVTRKEQRNIEEIQKDLSVVRTVIKETSERPIGKERDQVVKTLEKYGFKVKKFTPTSNEEIKEKSDKYLNEETKKLDRNQSSKKTQIDTLKDIYGHGKR